MKKIATDAISQPVIQLITILGFSVVIYLAALPNVLAEITPGIFTSFVTAMFMILTPLKRLTKINGKIQTGIAAAQSIFALLDTAAEKDTGKKTIDGRAEGRVSYRDVHFGYDDTKGTVINGISFDIKAGQTVAFVGHSGSGKTTLVNLLVRFYTCLKGQIKIDGIDINELTLKNLRSHIAFVNQQVVLFNDTIARNIAYGQNDVSKADIIAAAKAAHAWQFISNLPNGLATQVGQNGVLLSGGQRQRIAIARALLSDAPILILDEATSSLDAEAERHVQAALDTLMARRTTLVIAHRLSTIENADNIIVIHDGQIIERGNHVALLAKNKHYAALHRLQFQSS